MVWGLIFGLPILGAIVGAIVIYFDYVNEEDKIRKTKIIDTRVTGITGTVNRYIKRETTFVVYYKDGTHKIVKVMNGGMEYKMYLKYLEI